LSVTTGSAPWFLFLAPEIIMRVGSVSFQADSFLSNDGFAPSLGSGAWLGSVVFISEIEAEACPRAWFDFVETEERPLGKTNPSLFREICLLVLR
jgi:hypothetical protein